MSATFCLCAVSRSLALCWLVCDNGAESPRRSLETHVGYRSASIRAEFIGACRRATPRLIDVNVWYQLAESLKAASAFPNPGRDWWAPFYGGIHFLMTVSPSRSLLGLGFTAAAVAPRFIALIKKIKIKKWDPPSREALTVQTHFLLSVITAGDSGRSSQDTLLSSA